MGTKKGTGFDEIWEELGALENENGEPTEICNFENFVKVELSDGDIVTLYADADKLQEEFLRIAPEDKKIIKSFTNDLKKLSNFNESVTTEKLSLKDKIVINMSNVPSFFKMIGYVRMPLSKLSNKWKSPKLREVFSCVVPSFWSSTSLVFGLAMQHNQAAGYPVGGSLNLAKNIERRYLELGGTIHYSSKVEKIIVEEDKAIGLRLDNGKEFFGDEIVSAADGHTTLYTMLGGKYLNPQLQKAYTEFPLFPSSIFIGFGMAKDCSEIPHSIFLRPSEPLELPDGSKHEHFKLSAYHFDPTLSPKGKTSVTVIINTWNGLYWHELAKNDPDKYKTIKSEIVEKVLDIVESKFQGFRSAVEKTDISTPHTVIRYTGNWKGSYEGFAPTPETLMKKLPKEVKGLNNFHMIGHWTQPGGGIPPAAIDGRNIARKMCKKDNKKFISK